jgi:peptidoglycan/LPS O-acetylase OafA/YrhL
MLTNRNHGLDTLRSVAIILVLMFHYDALSTGKHFFGIIGHIGYIGVDLFFVLSGYLIGNQIFSAFVARKTFSLKIFYYRRLLRTLPNYLIVLALYFCIPAVRESPLTTPLWKFLTFTQNFDLHDSAFNQAWSLCIEEQFYLVLPLIALLIAYKGSIRIAWIFVATILFIGIICRASLWATYIQHTSNPYQLSDMYGAKIYYPTYNRLDGLMFGVALAMLQNFHPECWSRITTKGNVWFVLGLLGCGFTCYEFFNITGLFSTALGYPLRALSFAALTLAALSPGAWLNRTRIPGAMTLAVLSYAIYLTHKQLIYLMNSGLSYLAVQPTIHIVILTMIICLMGAWLLYTFIESPFLKLREKI